ncbi:MAG: nuclear transport factor 2 family protein [Pseudolabrys sp.]
MSDTRAIVRELYDAYGKGDGPRVAALLHDDIDWVIYAPVDVFPFAGARHGRQAVLAALADIGANYILRSYQPEVMIVDGDRAAVMSDVHFVQKSSGRAMRFRLANFLRLDGGRVIEFREFIDTFDAVEQALGRELAL